MVKVPSRRRFLGAMLSTGVVAGAVPALSFAQAVQMPTRGALVANAKPGDIRLIVSGAIQLPVTGVVDRASAVIGKPLTVEYGSAQGWLKADILAGQEFEVAILPADVNGELLRAGKVQPEMFEIAYVDVAIGVRGEAKDLDVSTPAKLKSALLAAKAVKYAAAGVALPTVEKILTTLQVGDKIKDMSRSREVVVLGPGEYDLYIYPVSEIVANAALRNLGQVPASLAVPTVIAAVIGTKTRDLSASKALIAYFQSTEFGERLVAAKLRKGRSGKMRIPPIQQGRDKPKPAGT
jgi:hypothetical protein